MIPPPMTTERNAKIGHAVALLNNHLPIFGAKHAGQDNIGGGDYFMDHVPATILAPLTTALENAARFLADEFDQR